MPPFNDSLMRTSFFDASAIVKLLCKNEAGSKKVKGILESQQSVFTSWILVGEAMGVLKRKWCKQEITEKEYASRILLLFTYIDERRFDIRDIEIRGNKPMLKTCKSNLFMLRKNHPELDVADAVQLLVIKEGLLGKLAEESEPRLVTADSNLKDAAIKENIKVEFID